MKSTQNRPHTYSQYLAAFTLLISSLTLWINVSYAADPIQAIQIYSQNDLLNMIKENTHLDRVKKDECQLVQDIEARASIMKIPAYQFLYGDMLAYGVCVKKDVELGVYYMRQAADQGLAEGLEQLGRYYHIGRFMQTDVDKAIVYLREAAALGNVNARIRLVEIFLDGHGSPLDFEMSYGWLHHTIYQNNKQHQRAQQLLKELEELMPRRVIERAKMDPNSTSVKP
ncbi:tetratricopeptide repeat protein [Flocculibacter collagenilyticus]|uniref:tetratricopeptide repeat protein n=1 Tax=Flocculibacter collagenilyticus TaxID=2744479 RepID=UPI0018F41A6B|nr:tetratricopeptide repeat protein [Flocculibacter collagenilyticus]